MNTANARIGTHAEGIGELMKQLEAARSELESAARNADTHHRTPLPAPRPNLRNCPKRANLKQLKPHDATEDKLTDIVGIGVVYAKRLRKEGISTFKALAKLKPAQLQKMINPATWQTLDFESWIEQARDRAKK